MDAVIRRWGIVVAIATAVRVVGSHGLTTYPFATSHVRDVIVRWTQAVGVEDGAGWARALTGGLENMRANMAVFQLAPLLIATAAFIHLYLRALRSRECATARIANQLFWWSVVFASLALLAAPNVEDFWMSVAWARMLADGLNPYYNSLTAADLEGLPLRGDEYFQQMVYGPLWAVWLGAAMTAVGTVGTAVVSKFALFGAWVGTLAIIRRLASEDSRAVCLGVLTFGWIPLGIDEAVAEGHTDIVMMFAAIVWLRFLEGGKVLTAHLALVASILIKYVSGALAIVSMIHLRHTNRRTPTWLLEIALPAAVGLAVIAVFAHDLNFLRPLWQTRDWIGFRPREALELVEPVIGGRIATALGLAAQLCFAMLAIRALGRYWVTNDRAKARYAALAVMTAVLFGSGWRIYPWYLLWPLTFVPLSLESRLGRWVVGVCLVFPFGWRLLPLIPEILLPYLGHATITLALYAVPLLWIWMTSDGARPRRSAGLTT